MIIPNSREHRIISKYLRYHNLLDGNGIPPNKRGASIARHELQHNKIISELLGYHAPKEEINFIYKDPNYFKYEVIKVEDKNCLFCGEKLEVVNLNKITKCSGCLCSNYNKPIGFYEHLDSGDNQDRIEKEDEYTFNHKFFDLNVKFEFTEKIHKKCARVHIQRLLNRMTVKIKFKSLIYKVNININRRLLLHFDKIEYPENVKNSHLSILGWRRLSYKY